MDSLKIIWLDAVDYLEHTAVIGNINIDLGYVICYSDRCLKRPKANTQYNVLFHFEKIEKPEIFKNKCYSTNDLLELKEIAEQLLEEFNKYYLFL